MGRFVGYLRGAEPSWCQANLALALGRGLPPTRRGMGLRASDTSWLRRRRVGVSEKN